MREGEPSAEELSVPDVLLVRLDGFFDGEANGSPPVFPHIGHIFVAQLAERLPKRLAGMGQLVKISLAAVGQVGVGVVLKADAPRERAVSDDVVGVSGVDQSVKILFLKSGVVLLEQSQHAVPCDAVIPRQPVREDLFQLETLPQNGLEGRMGVGGEQAVDLGELFLIAAREPEVFQGIRELRSEEGEGLIIKRRVFHECPPYSSVLKERQGKLPRE